MTLTAIFAVAFLTAPFAPLVVRFARPVAGWLLALVPASAALMIGLHVFQAPGVEPQSVSLPWVSALQLSLSLRLDGLAALFALLVSTVGVFVFIYAGAYLRDHPHLGRFFSFLLIFLGGMLGIALADNLLLLYVCWELTTVSSWLLIGFENERSEAREAAWKALIVTGAGGFAMLVGFVLLGSAAGTYAISSLTGQAQDIRESALYTPILLLILTSAVAKSALVPLHFWLPNAMAAPTPVSAYLHSAAMVKAGVFLLARLSPTLADTGAWHTLVIAIGVVTAVAAGVLALLQTDLKRLLAYTTISALGMMTLALGIGTTEAVHAALVLLLAHGLYKGALFMVAGAIDHGAGSRDLREVGGLRRSLPLTALASALAVLSMVGLPPTLGFIAEEKLVEATLHHHGIWGWIALAGTLLSGTLYTAAGFVAGLRPFLGRERAPREPHEPRAGLWAPAMILGVAGIVLAFLPRSLDSHLIAPATADAAGEAPESHLALWHGVTTSFLLGVAMLVAGAVVAAGWGRLRAAVRSIADLSRWGPDRAYEAMIGGMNHAARRLSALLQHGYLPLYLLIVLLTGLVMVAPPLWRAGIRFPEGGGTILIHDVLIVGVLLAGAIGAVRFHSRLAVVACTGVVGLGVALLFVLYSAPDLAMTQVLVEVILTVLIVLLLPRIPAIEEFEPPRVRLGHALVCGCVGALVTVLLLTTTAGDQPNDVAAYFREHSVEAAHGRNIVNTILVNFRAVDTLGEVGVLAAATLGVLTLLEGSPMRARRQKAAHESMILPAGAVVLLPLMLVFSVYLLVTGHERPGGGFAGALVMASSLALYLFGRPRSTDRELIRLRPRALLALGLLLMTGSGALALFAGDPFLTAQWLESPLPILGGLHAGTPLIFDIGVYLASAGAIFLLLRTLEEQSPWRF